MTRTDYIEIQVGSTTLKSRTKVYWNSVKRQRLDRSCGKRQNGGETYRDQETIPSRNSQGELETVVTSGPGSTLRSPRLYGTSECDGVFESLKRQRGLVGRV